MTAMPVAQRMTAEEYLALEPTDELRWAELIDGELVVSQPNIRHNAVQGNLFVALSMWIRAANGRGRVCLPLDVQLDEFNVFAPDISWYAQSHDPGLEAQRPYPRTDLVAEVRSPSTWIYDIGTKKRTYERHGVSELWLVDTLAEQVLVFRRSTAGVEHFDMALELGRDAVLGSPLLRGFRLALDELFPHG